MKKLIILLSLMLFASEALAACGDPGDPCKQCTSEAVAANTASVSFSTLPIIGNAIIPFSSSFNAGGIGALLAYSDNQSGDYTHGGANAYDVRSNDAGGQVDLGLGSAHVTASSGTYTVSVTDGGGGTTFNLMACEFTGLDSSAWVDKIGTSDAISGTSNTTTASGANAQANELIFTAQIQGDISPTTGYSNGGTLTTVSARFAYKAVTGVETSAATWASSAFTVGSGLISTNKYTPPAPPASGNHNLLLLGVGN